MKNAEYFHRLIELAEQQGFSGAAYEAVLNSRECHLILRNKAEEYVDNALSGIESCEVFLFHLADHMEKWREVLTEDDCLTVANALRGAKIIKGFRTQPFGDGLRFGDQPWWPS